MSMRIVKPFPGGETDQRGVSSIKPSQLSGWAMGGQFVEWTSRWGVRSTQALAF
jgi:hypothetical protein